MKIKRILTTVVLSLGAVFGLIMLAFFTLSEEFLIGWVVKQVESSAGVQVHYQSAELHRDLTPTLDVKQLQISADDDHYHIKTTSLQLSVSLPYLLLARLDIPALQIGDTQVTMSADKVSEPDGEFDLGAALGALHFKPVLHDFRIASLSLSAEGTEWQMPSSQVSEISLQLTADEKTPSLSANVDVAADKLHIQATLPNFSRAMQQKRLPFSVSVKGIHVDGELEGVLDFSAADSMLEATLNARVEDLGRVPVGIEGLSIPGELHLQSGIAGALDKLAAKNVTVQWQDNAGSSAELKGQVSDVVALTSVDLALTGTLADAAWLMPVLPEDMGDIASAKLTGAIGGARDRLLISDVQLDAVSSKSLDLHLSGDFELAMTDKHGYQIENIQAGLKFEAPTTHAARALLFEEIPELGAVQASSDIRSKTGDPVFDNISVATRSKTGIEAQLAGRIEQFPLDPDRPNHGYDLNVTINADKTQALLKAVDLELALDGSSQLQFRIQGDTPALQLNAIELTAGSDTSVRIDAAGSMLFGDWSKDDPLQSLDLQVDASSKDTQALGRFATTEVLPEMGALKVHGHVHTVAGKHRVDDFGLHTAEGAPVQIALTGSASELTVFPEPLLGGMQLEFSGQGNDTAALNALFGFTSELIPPVGSFKVVSTVTGSSKQLTIANTDINAGSKELLSVTAKGRLGKIDAATGWSFHDTDLKLEAQSDSTQALAKASGIRLPPLGPISATAGIDDKDGVLGVSDLQLGVGQVDDKVLFAQGRIGDLINKKDVDIDAKLNIDGHNLAAFSDHDSLQDLSPLTGHLHIGDKDGVLGMQTLVLSSKHESLTVDIKGSFTDFTKPETLSLDAQLDARDLALVGALFDKHWPPLSPFTVKAVVEHDKKKHVQLRAGLGADKQTIDVDLRGDFSSVPPRISGKLTAEQFAIPDFFEKVAEKRKEKQEDEKKLSEHVFSRENMTFERLKAFDLDLDVNVVSFNPAESGAESAEARIKLESGLLQIRPAVIKYDKGALDVDLVVDARQLPDIRFSAKGNDISSRGFVPAQPGESSVELKGDYGVDIQLSAKGQSPHELASSMEGNLMLVTNEGQIRRSLLSLLFLDITGWVADRVKINKFVDVTCSVADFSVEQGLITTNALFLDTKSITVTGEGEIDLGKETVKYVLLPKKKSRLIVKAEPVTIKGSLGNPKVSAMPVRSAARTFGTLLFAPYIFVGLSASEFATGQLQSDKDDTPCLNYERAHDKVDPGPEPAH